MSDRPAARKTAAEAEALRMMQYQDRLPSDEKLLHMLEFAEVHPALIDLIARRIGVDYRPWLVPEGLVDKPLWPAFIRAVAAESEREPDPYEEEPSAYDIVALEAVVTEGLTPGQRRSVHAMLPRWRAHDGYREAVETLREERERNELYHYLLEAHSAGNSEEESAEAKKQFFRKLLDSQGDSGMAVRYTFRRSKREEPGP